MCVFYSIVDVARVLTLIAILYNHSYSPLVYYSPPLLNQPIHSHPPIRIPPNPLCSYHMHMLLPIVYPLLIKTIRVVYSLHLNIEISPIDI